MNRQDLKTGHLLHAAPRAQFWGQLIGSTVGAVVSAFLYKLYTNVYEIPGKLFEVRIFWGLLSLLRMDTESKNRSSSMFYLSFSTSNHAVVEYC